MQQSRTKEEKQELIQLYKQSGMSVRAFVEEFKLNLATFRNWLYKKQPEAKPADDNLNFVEVKATQKIKFSGRQDIRIQKNGIEISIPADSLNSNTTCLYHLGISKPPTVWQSNVFQQELGL